MYVNAIRFIGISSNNKTNIPLQLDLENNYVFVPTPALISNNTQVATTAWVNTKVGGFANTNASNFTSAGKQTIVGWGMPDYSTGISSLDATLPYDSFVYCRNNAGAGGPDALFTIYDLSGNLISQYRLVWSESAQFYIKKGYRYTVTGGINPEAYYYKLGV